VQNATSHDEFFYYPVKEEDQETRRIYLSEIRFQMAMALEAHSENVAMICRYVLDTSIAIFLGTKTSSAHSGAHLL
jgi:Uma2 family endonuclease